MAVPVFAGQLTGRAAILDTHLRIGTCVRNVGRMVETLSRLSGRRPLGGAVLSSVVPAVNPLWRKALRRVNPRMRVLWVSHRLKLGLPVLLIGIALFFALKPGLSDADRVARVGPALFAAGRRAGHAAGSCGIRPCAGPAPLF